ncbi:MAG TPA: hypothetical protein VGO67_06345 [Verrucomicrobiae bacterium]
MSDPFTIDGTAELEASLHGICETVRREVSTIVPQKKLAAIVLGGGYGRGEGGVLKTEAGDAPYNDLEFYIFLKGNRLWHDYKFGKDLHDLGHQLSTDAGLSVEFKIDCVDRWRSGPVSMFSYDLVSGHRMVSGDEGIFSGCEHHRESNAIPLAEASRLLFNRCAGLLLVREILRKPVPTEEDADFAVRNMAKVQLALGDVVLTAFGKYHWSVLERNRRLAKFVPPERPHWLPEVQSQYSHGVAFKLHPRRSTKLEPTFETEYLRLVDLAKEVWLWLESRRLNEKFLTASDYALGAMDKWPGTAAWRNFCLTVKTFGPKAAVATHSGRYPRARLFNALTLLLWNSNQVTQPPFLHRLQSELHTNAADWPGLVTVFKRVWPAYG